MKKLMMAMMVLCTMALSFTSCEKNADPLKEPVAGKTFMAEEDGSSIKFIFHMNHNLTNVLNDQGNIQTQTNMVWEMNSNAKDFKIKWAYGSVNVQTGENVSGKTVYEGVYDAEKKQITVTMQGTKGLLIYTCSEVQ